MAAPTNTINDELQLERKIRHDIALNPIPMQCSPANAEYLVQLPSDVDVTPDQRKAIYDILMTFAFPMNTDPENRIRIENSLTTEELEALNNSEMYFLQDKINDEIVKGVRLIPIPKTIYQLYLAAYAFSQTKALPEFRCTDYTSFSTIEITPDRVVINYEKLIDLVRAAPYVDAWWKVNNVLLNEWHKITSFEAVDTFIDTQIERLVALVSAEPCILPKPYLAAATSGRKLSIFLKDYSADHNDAIKKAKTLIKTVVLEEILEPKNYLLYQTDRCPSDPAAETSLPVTENEAPKYFCDGLLTSFLYELSESPLRNYMMYPKPRLFIYNMDKQKYLSNDISQKPLFFIPAFPRMCTLTLSNWGYNLNFPRNDGELKTLAEDRLQEKEGLLNVGEELQKTQNQYQQLQDAATDVGIPKYITGIIFQYTNNTNLGNLIFRREANVDGFQKPRRSGEYLN